VLVCPATANTLNRIAAGMADDLAGALLLAHDWKKPLLVAPAMNPAMWAHPATVASVARLRQWGVRFVEVGAGRTACGEVGEGRLAEPEEIVAAVEAALAPPARRLRVLVTSGGTAEPIDAVRVITNMSTGATGALIAENFARRGHAVTLLRAASARGAEGVSHEETFVTFAELDAALSRLLREESLDVVIHAAAVSDFSIATVEVDGVERAPGSAKLGSGSAPILRLKTNPKLLDTLRARSRNSAMKIVAFKLTNDASATEARAAVERLFAEGAVDFVVHNDLANRDEKGVFPAEVWGPRGEMVEYCADRRQIGVALEKLLSAQVVTRNDVAKPAKV
jgi:phosphopantothenoylcysteine decarboxylase/phosphopantothenate--cysteine ligase